MSQILSTPQVPATHASGMISTNSGPNRRSSAAAPIPRATRKPPAMALGNAERPSSMLKRWSSH